MEIKVFCARKYKFNGKNSSGYKTVGMQRRSLKSSHAFFHKQIVAEEMKRECEKRCFIKGKKWSLEKETYRAVEKAVQTKICKREDEKGKTKGKLNSLPRYTCILMKMF